MRPLVVGALATCAFAVPMASAKGPGVHDRTPAVVARTEGGVTTVRLLPSFGASRAIAQRRISGRFEVATVAVDGATVARSRNGSTIVLQEVVHAVPTRRFAIMDGALRRPTRYATLPIRFTVDALSPNGRKLFLTEAGTREDPLSYAVRVYDTVSGTLRPEPVIEKGGEQMAGEPIARAEHPTQGWSYTLYAGGHEPFVHALNTTQGYSLCIDLPWPDLTRARAVGMRLRIDAQDGLRIVTSTAPVRTLAIMNRGSGTIREVAAPLR